MTKFTLIIWVCSFLAPDLCMKPVVYPTLYNSWYECSRAAHRESIKILSSLGYKYINQHKVGTRYICKIDKTI
jgi:hypothetical protein